LCRTWLTCIKGHRGGLTKVDSKHGLDSGGVVTNIEASTCRHNQPWLMKNPIQVELLSVCTGLLFHPRQVAGKTDGDKIQYINPINRTPIISPPIEAPSPAKLMVRELSSQGISQFYFQCKAAIQNQPPFKKYPSMRRMDSERTHSNQQTRPPLHREAYLRIY